MEYCDIVIPLWEKTDKENLLKSINSLIDESKFIKNIILVIDGCKNYPKYLPNDHILESKFIIVYKFKNYGPGIARNCGVIFSKSENIIFLDAGDININKRVESQLKSLSNNDACLANIKENRPRFPTLIRKSCSTVEIAKKVIAYKTPYNNVTLAIRKKAFEETGGYPPLRTAEDWVLMGKIIKNNLRIITLDKIFVSIDIDEEFNSRRRGKRVFKDILKCLKFLYDQQIITKYDLFFSIIINFIFRLILPKKVFKYLYRILRTYFLNLVATFEFKKKPSANINKDTIDR